MVSDLTSLRAILSKEEACFVRPDDSASLAAGLRELLGDEDRRSRITARLRERSAEHTWDARARRLLDWMKERAA